MPAKAALELRQSIRLLGPLLVMRRVTIDRDFEFKYMVGFAYESYLIEELARDQFRALWMAYCLHHNLDADTSEYDDDLAQLWNVVFENGDGTTEWSDYDSFNNFMSRYLV